MLAIAIILLFSLYSSIYFISDCDSSRLTKSVAIVVLLTALYLGMQRDTFLPFLYRAAFPPSLIKDVHVPPHANVSSKIKVDAPDGTKVAYWAAISSKTIFPDPHQAYANYGNTGVAEVKNGKATLKFSCPSQYVVPWGQTLEKHVHYRVIYSDGMMSRVNTVFVKCT
jgi:hypothetical protein